MWGQVAPAPSAASAAKGEDILTLEAFVTTGSNIKRLENENVLPITVFNKSQIQARDAATSFELLESVSQITTFPKNETSTNAVAARGGNAAAALRGVAQGNTLTLLNGRRMPYNPFSSLAPADSTVNVNTLPSVGLQQVEVLRDGASSIYGADAVAGVINFITDPELTGGTMTLRLGATEHGGGGSIQATINYGSTFAEGKGRITGSLSVYSRDAIYLSQREVSESTNRLDESRPPWQDVVGGPYDGRSSTQRWPSFRKGEAAVSGTVNWFYPVNGTPTLTTTSLPRDLYSNYNQFIIGQPFSTRTNLFTQLEYDLSDSITVFGEVLGYYAESKTGRAPITLSSSDARVTLSADNPYNPFGSSFYAVGGDGVTRINGTPTPITITSMQLYEGGPERVEASDRVYRLLGGFKGSIGATSWKWETAAMYGQYKATDYLQNGVRDSLLLAAAQRTDANAWNPFGYTFKIAGGKVVADQEYVNPQAVQDSYTVRADRVGHTSIGSLDARASGELVDLWAGPISASLGAEYRLEHKEDYKPPYISVNPENDPTVEPGNNDLLVTSPKYNYSAERTIVSAYAETVVPLIAPKNNIPFAKTLEVSASVRYENYDDFGNATKPKFGINWRATDWLMVRASYNQGFHAPDLTNMNQPASFSVGSPPGARDSVRDNYLTGAGLGSDVQVLSKSYTTPNPDLGPEESEGISAGVVVEVPFVKGLSLSVDYWEITQENLIINKSRDTADDTAMLLAYTQQQLAAGKNILDIDVGSFTSPSAANTYKGDPNTLRAAVTADDKARFAPTYAVLPQSQWIAPLGQWIGSTAQLINGTGTAFTNGFDYQLDYNLPRTPLGSFRFSTNWSMFLNKFVKETPDDIKDDDIIAYELPKWKGSTTLIWRKGQWSASASAVWQSQIYTTTTTNLAGYEAAGMPDYIKVINNNGNTVYYEVGDPQMQINLGASYAFGRDANAWLKNTTLRVGINNVLDDKPALYDENGTGYSGGTGTSLWVGRAYTLSISRQF